MICANVDFEVLKEVKKSDGEDEEAEVESGTEEQGTTDNKRLLPASHYIGEKYLWEMTEKVDPNIAALENDKVFTVPTYKVEIETKIGKDQQPRFLTDEGMYIGQTPNVSKGKNQNKMEQRVLKEQENQGLNQSKWFGTDGKLVALPNPLRKKATRPSNLDDDLVSDQDPLTFFCPPTLPGPDNLPVPVNPSGKMSSISQCQLEIDLSSIVFEHHHLFSIEHYLTTKLTKTFLLYTKIKTAQVSKDLDKRLEVLYKSIEELKSKEFNWAKEEMDFQFRRLETYRKEIKAMRSERDSDSEEERKLARAILELWKEIRILRHTQGYNNTNHKIVIKKVL